MCVLVFVSNPSLCVCVCWNSLLDDGWICLLTDLDRSINRPTYHNQTEQSPTLWLTHPPPTRTRLSRQKNATTHIVIYSLYTRLPTASPYTYPRTHIRHIITQAHLKTYPLSPSHITHPPTAPTNRKLSLSPLSHVTHTHTHTHTSQLLIANFPDPTAIAAAGKMSLQSILFPFAGVPPSMHAYVPMRRWYLLLVLLLWWWWWWWWWWW
jgi:hypothetical protein